MIDQIQDFIDAQEANIAKESEALEVYRVDLANIRAWKNALNRSALIADSFRGVSWVTDSLGPEPGRAYEEHIRRLVFLERALTRSLEQCRAVIRLAQREVAGARKRLLEVTAWEGVIDEQD